MQDFKVIHSKKRDFIVIKSDDKKCRIVEAHKFIYESINGPVPEGYEIHHIDFNKYNNDISNLIALPREQHKKYHACVNYMTGIVKIYKNMTQIPNSKKAKDERRYRELYNQGFRPVKIYKDRDYEHVIMRDCVGNDFNLLKPFYVVDVEGIKIEKYSYAQLIEMGYKFIKEVFDGVTISYQFKSPFGNKICFKECDLFSK